MKKFVFFLVAIFSFSFSEASKFKYDMNPEFKNAYKKKFPEIYTKDPKCKRNYFMVFKKWLTDSPIIFEAGGFDGSDTIKFAKKFPKGFIITFEPNPNAFIKLMQKIEGFTNVGAHQLAVNDKNGKALLYVCHGTYGKNPLCEGASSLLEPTKNMEIHYMGPRIQVPCVVLDDWCEKNKVNHIDFMWLDLEGVELKVLKSSLKILKTVKMIHTETNFFMYRKKVVQYSALKKFLNNQGFVMVAHWYIPNLQGNALFVRKEILNEFIKTY